MMSKKSFSERIKRLRKNKGLKQTEAAKGIGISYGTYQRYEYGYSPSRSNFEKIAAFYGCSLSWLMTGEGEPFPGKQNNEGINGRPAGQSAVRRPADEPGRWAIETDILQPVNERAPEYNRDARKGIPKDDQYPAFPNSSFDLAKAIELAVRVLGSGTSYAYALYLNVIHFDRAILAESRIAVLEKKCEELEKKVERLLDIADKVEKLEEENRELHRQLNLMRESRERSEDLNPASGGSA